MSSRLRLRRDGREDANWLQLLILERRLEAEMHVRWRRWSVCLCRVSCESGPEGGMRVPTDSARAKQERSSISSRDDARALLHAAQSRLGALYSHRDARNVRHR